MGQPAHAAKPSNAARPPDLPASATWTMAKVKLFDSKASLKQLQDAIDTLTKKARHKTAFTDDEKAFLKDMFYAFSRGGRALGYVEAAKLSSHYVDGDGVKLELDSDVYAQSIIVRDVEAVMRRQIALDVKGAKGGVVVLSSADARLAKRDDFQALCAKSRDIQSQGRVLHHGWLLAEQDNQRLQKANNRFQVTSTSQASVNGITTTWRVDDEYVFEAFDKGFVTEISLGPGLVLEMPDGLSKYMTTLGIAKEFKHFATWQEDWQPDSAATAQPSAKTSEAQHPKTKVHSLRRR